MAKPKAKGTSLPIGIVDKSMALWVFFDDEKTRDFAKAVENAIVSNYYLKNFGPAMFGLPDEGDS